MQAVLCLMLWVQEGTVQVRMQAETVVRLLSQARLAALRQRVLVATARSLSSPVRLEVRILILETEVMPLISLSQERRADKRYMELAALVQILYSLVEMVETGQGCLQDKVESVAVYH